MRWFWIDGYTEFVSGRSATAVKNVSLSEDFLHDHFPNAPVMPNALILEGIAQTGGLLVGERTGFLRQVVLAKVPRVRFFFLAQPGDSLTYHVTVKEIQERGVRVEATSHIAGKLQAEVEILFAYLDADRSNQPLFKSADFMSWLRMVRLFEVGRTEDGQLLPLPPHLAAAEAACATS